MTDAVENVCIIILAAGKGTRMKSEKAKVLHEINGMPMLNHVLAAGKQIAGAGMVVVVGHQSETVKTAVLKGAYDQVRFALQAEQLGTGHAVQCAMPYLPEKSKNVLILCGDVPLISASTIRALLREHNAAKRDLTVLAVELANPTGYGRMIIDPQNRVTAIVEEADATPAQKGIRIVNAGIYCTTRSFLADSLWQIRADNAQGEFYLTDLMEIGRRKRKNVGALVWGDSREVMGVNTLKELELAETVMKRRIGKTS